MAGQWRGRPQDEFESKHETPWPIGHRDRAAPDELDIDPVGLMSIRRPETTIQALMETAPGDTPLESVEEQATLAETLADALDAMGQDSPRHLWVFQAHVNRGLSFREIGDELNISKSHAHFLYQQAQQRLRHLLGDYDELR